MEQSSNGSITNLLAQMSAGNRDAENLLIAHVYQELRRTAARYLRQERQNHTLQPTALVNEAYLRLVGNHDQVWQNKAHFFAVAAKVMRQILVDHARARQASRRGGENQQQITLEEPLLGSNNNLIDVLVLHELIEQLSALDERQGQVVELHYFGGLTIDEIAAVVKMSTRNVKRDLSMAKDWLRSRLAPAQ